MDSLMRNPLSNVAEKVIEYLPSLFAGIVLMLVGWLLGWVVKRIVFQLCVLLRIERILGTFRWGADFSKADVRHALFNSIGSVAFFLIFLVFLNAAFSTMDLTVLSNLIEKSVSIVPKLIIALIIAGIGWILARWVGLTVRKTLAKEDIPRATLIARFSSAVLILFFSAMALVELDIAREIVIIGFTVIIITLGALSVVLTAIGGRPMVRKVLASLDEE
jgi:Mechanosensitive ion channel, conserved TM helix